MTFCQQCLLSLARHGSLPQHGALCSASTGIIAHHAMLSSLSSQIILDDIGGLGKARLDRSMHTPRCVAHAYESDRLAHLYTGTRQSRLCVLGRATDALKFSLGIGSWGGMRLEATHHFAVENSPELLEKTFAAAPTARWSRAPAAALGASQGCPRPRVDRSSGGAPGPALPPRPPGDGSQAEAEQ
jgi:hypothetical protein